jgi:hypothetical protein
MRQPESKHEDIQAAESKSSVKKPYLKPQARYERVFETMALACGKVGDTTHACSLNRKTS